MGDDFAIWCSPSKLCRGLHSNWTRIFLVIWPALAFSADSAVPMGQVVSDSKASAVGSGFPSLVVGDVVLQHGDELQGVVLADALGPERGTAVAGARVVLATEGKVVAETVSDQAGRFRVSHLHGGKYLICVAGKGGSAWSLHRLWTPQGAPPRASGVAQVILGRKIVRGQGPLPAVSFSEAALMGGVVVGAVAAPVIYHNAQQSNRIPASP